MKVTIISNSLVYQEVLNTLTSVIPGTSVIGNFLMGEAIQSQEVAPQTDLLIMDYGKEEASDLNILKWMRRKSRKMGVLVVSRGNHPALRESLQSRGVDGCIERFSLDADLEPAMQRIHQGGLFFK